MVQFIQRAQSNADRFAKAFSGASQNAAQLIPEELMQRRERKDLGGLIGEDLSNIRNPDFQKMILGQGLKKKALNEQYSADNENYNKIKEAFGPKFADIWISTGQGERTALTKAAIEARSRGIDLDQILGGQGTSKEQRGGVKSNAIKTPGGQDFNLPEIQKPEGQTPAELVKYEKELRTDNNPIYKENINKRRGLKDTGQHLKILESLNDKIEEGIPRLLIDKEGNIRSSALRFKAVSKETERFAKTINDFLTSAKDIFGARVTNYDIAQFKSRLPGLLNSKEGRSDIIKQMKIFNQIEQNYRDALNSVYQNYGLGGIPQEQAERLAEQMISEEEENLRSELLEIGNESNESSSSNREKNNRPSLEEIFG